MTDDATPPADAATDGASTTSVDLERVAYDELCLYSLAHGGPEFIHQHVVDAFMVQHADTATKPIGLTFGLVGLYLHVERRFTGKQVQRVHMALARGQRSWPSFPLPRDRGELTATAVMQAPPGPARDQAIDAWCDSVWEAFRDCHAEVAALLDGHPTLGPLLR